jgi:large subunit ribosomal protein L2
MGKRIIPQRRGRGSPTYRTTPRRLKALIMYKEANGKVVDILNSTMRSAPIALVEYSDKSKGYIIAPEGIKVGDNVRNFVKPLSEIPIGKEVFGIETVPKSGPKLCLSAGSSAILISKEGDKAVLQLPSKKQKKVNLKCMATIGIPAGDGRKEKPWIKAGKKWIAMHARGKLYPRTSPVKMNAVDHPYGGKSGIGRSKSVSRHAPPGRKVGSISSRRTGRRKR